MKIFKINLTAIGALIALIAVFSCNNQVKTETSIVKANIEGMSGQKAVLQNLSPLVLESDTASFDEAGNLIFNLNIKKPTYYSLGVGRTKMILYVRPSDSVIFTASMPNLMSSVRFSGDAPIYNDYLIRFNNISSNFQGQLMKIFAKQENVVSNAIDSLRALHADEIANLQRGNSNLDPYFLRIEKARILYEWALLYRIYPNYYQYIHHDNSFKTSPEYDTYLAETDLNNAEIVDLPLYVSFLETYMRNFYESYYTDSLSSEFHSFVNYQLNLIDKQFENQDIKSIMAYNAVKQQIEYDGVKDMETYWAKFNTICLNKELLEDINRKLAEWKHLKKGEPAKDFTFVNIKGENVSLSDFKGKWVYIDIWATWCSPCMHEVPFLKKLEEDLNGENIVFMSISVDKTQEPWIKTVEEMQMKGVQLWAGQNDVIKNFYKVSGIPRFMIIDPKGNIYSSSADRPSAGIGEKLKSLLSKKSL